MFHEKAVLLLSEEAGTSTSCFLHEKVVPLLNEKEGANPLLFYEKAFLPLSEEADAYTSFSLMGRFLFFLMRRKVSPFFFIKGKTQRCSQAKQSDKYFFLLK